MKNIEVFGSIIATKNLIEKDVESVIKKKVIEGLTDGSLDLVLHVNDDDNECTKVNSVHVIEFIKKT